MQGRIAQLLRSAAVMLLCTLGARAAETTATLSAMAPVEGWSSVSINDVLQDEAALVYRDAQGLLYTRAEDLERWQLAVVATGDTLEHRGQQLKRIASRPGLEVRYDAEAQALALQVNPWLLPQQLSSAPA